MAQQLRNAARHRKATEPIFSSNDPFTQKDEDLDLIPSRNTFDTAKNQYADRDQIDMNEETVHNNQDLKFILEKGYRIKRGMEEALGENPWEQLHGQYEVPKKYKNPFDQAGEAGDNADDLYSCEIEAQLQLPSTRQNNQQDQVKKPQTNEQMESAVQDMQNTEFGGTGGNLTDMRFIRLKVKNLVVDTEDIDLKQLLLGGFSLNLDLPLPPVTEKASVVNTQKITLTNYTVVTPGTDYLFNNMNLYNFRAHEDTFSQFSDSLLEVTIQTNNKSDLIKGSIPMKQLLLAPNFQLKTRIPIAKITRETVHNFIQPAETKKQQKGGKNQTKVEEVNKREFNEIRHELGYLSIEVNLQMGDTEEELMRNYKAKLNQQEEYRKKQEEIELLERRKRAVMMMEAQPTFAQLYLHVEKVGPGGISVPRQNTRALPGEALPPRNLYITYKSFPTLEKMTTGVQYNSTAPEFGYRSQFPILMSPNFIEKLESFVFILEVWDNVSPEKDELVGLVKIPLASFCYSLRTTESDIFSLNFLADQHNMYPMVIVDEMLPIYSPLLGSNVGFLKVMMALGSPIQVNRQIERENEKEQEQRALKQAEERNAIQAQMMANMAVSNGAGNGAGGEQRMKELIDENNDKNLKLEEEAMDRNPLLKTFVHQGSPQMKRKNPAEKFANALRQSLGADKMGDYDLRQNSMLNCMRKLFEEIRASPDLTDLNSEDIFGPEVRLFTGEVHKDDFIYCVLEKEQFTLTRTEASNVVQIMLGINPLRDEKERLDLDELQYSFISYCKYYELISSRVADLLEKIKLAVVKKLQFERIEVLIESILDASTESKIQPRELRRILEDENGIILRDSVYDQLLTFFDLDRNGQIYIQSVVQYLEDQQLQNFNFFKVNSNVITAHITDYVRNCISSRQDLQLEQLEQAFLEELDSLPRTTRDPKEDKKKSKKDKAFEQSRTGLLIQERINARVFQSKLKRQGIALSLWEIFTLFEYLNTTISKQVFYEPNRYHAILFQDFYTLITGKDDYREDLQGREQNKNVREKGKKGKKERKGEEQEQRREDPFVQPDNKHDESDIMRFSEANDDDSDLDDLSDDYDSELDFDPTQANNKYKQRLRDEKKPYHQIKHVYDIQIKQLQQIPLLAKFIRDTDDNENAQYGKQNLVQSSYIQNVAVKYSFPLDEEEIYESDYIKRQPCQEDDHTIYNFEVSMNTVHTYKLNRNDSIKNHLQKGSQQFFNISVILYQNQQEFVIGNAQLPIEDLCDMVTDYENKQNSWVKKSDTSILRRVVFLYGTSYSQRENCIIGKIGLEISYGMVRQVLTKREAAMLRYQKQDDQSCYMHRETYINRKIPLNALLSVYIDRVTGLKESIENIEHFAKINNLPQDEQKVAPSSQKLDRRRILTQILQKGLNLQIMTSVFEEDPELRERFVKAYHETRVLYNSLNPIYLETFQLPIQMDTKIFDYLKTKRCVFEVRHYLKPESKDQDPTENYLTLGWVRVPLLHLITKNNGIDGDFVILDDYKQKMGTLKLRIALNHHNLQRPLFQGSNRVPKEPTIRQPNTMINQSIKRSIENLDSFKRQDEHHIHYLGLNFVELVMRARSDLLRSDSRTNQLYLKFTLGGEQYMTKFIPVSQAQNQLLGKVDMMSYDLNRTIFVEIDMANTYQVEQLMSKPLEVQLWHKVTSEVRYHQPSTEEMIGSFFLELNELPKYHNQRVKPQPNFVCHESYYTMYDFKLEKVERERMAMRLFLFKKTDSDLLNDLEHVFNTTANTNELDRILWDLEHKLDPNQKGYCEVEDLCQLVQECVSDKRTALSLKMLICDNLEFKNSDSVYYSPLISLPPPYFRYGHDLDSLDSLIHLVQECRALDSHQQGFVPHSLFKQVCDKLRIKNKIVEDFIAQSLPNMLDCNITSNSLNVGLIDYVLLIRKLIRSLPKARDPFTKAQSLVNEKVDSLKMTVRIESAMRLKNPLNPMEPPSSFVRVNAPYDGCVCNIETKVVNQSCYPYWMGQNFPIEIPLTDTNIDKIQKSFLEFEVFNRVQHGNEELIGVAFVDISSLYLLNSAEASRMISGYYHIVAREAIQSNIQLSQVNSSDLNKLSYGQLKVTLLMDKELTHIKPQQAHETMIEHKHNSPQKQITQTFGGQQSFHGLNNPSSSVEQYQFSDEEEDYTSNDDSRFKHQQLREQLLSNLSELDNIQQKMQQSLSGESSSLNLGQTQKYDNQRASLAKQIGGPGLTQTGIFNPFESKINEHADEDEDDDLPLDDLKNNMNNSEIERD